MPFVTLACLPLVALTAAAAPVEAPKPSAGVRFSYRFTEGEVVRYRAEHAVTFVARKAGVTERNVQRTESEQSYRVVSVAADGVATLRLSIDKVRMEAGFDGGSPSVYDSDAGGSEVAPPQFDHVARAIRRPLVELRVRPDGTIAESTPLLPNDEAKPLGGSAGEESGVFVVFPKRPLAVGEEWTDTFKAKVTPGGRLSREVTLIRTYKLDRIENGEAVIAVKSALLTPVADPALLVQLIQRRFTGTIRFDLAAGRLTGRTSECDNTEMGWSGGDSSLRVVGRRTERLVTETPTAVSSR